MREPWFVYSVTAGRLTARPATAKGWIVFVAAIMAPTGCMLLIGPALMALHPLLFAAALVAVLGGTLFLLFKLVIAKGHRADP